MPRKARAADSVFDDMATLRQAQNGADNMAALRRVQNGGGRPSRRARALETFARIPHERGLQLYGRIDGAAWVVLLELDRLILKSRGRNPVPLTNKNLQAIGVPRNTKARALRQLQDAGVITFEQQGREAPLVTHLWYPVSS
jgi:hypothetical protein